MWGVGVVKGQATWAITGTPVKPLEYLLGRVSESTWHCFLRAGFLG